MALSLSTLSLSLAISLMALAAPARGAEAVAKAAAGDFDFFFFVQTWPGSFCEKIKCDIPTLDSVDGFSIHGLWPNFANGSYPSFCDETPFDEKAITDLIPRLKTEWADLKGMGDWLWSHEWTKHGTCAKPVTGDEHGYFTAALGLREKVDFIGALKAHGIKPGMDKWPLADLVSAMKVATGGPAPYIHCKAGEVSEAWLCVDKSLAIVDCAADKMPVGTSCPATVRLPAPEGHAVVRQAIKGAGSIRINK